MLGRFLSAAGRGAWLKREESIMGTAIVVELWADEQGCGEAAITAVMDEMRRIDRTMSPHKENSELSIINRDAGRRPVPVSAEMARLIVRAAEFSELSGGAFDITYAAVGHLYDYRNRVRPGEAELAAARAAVGWRHLVLDSQAGTVRFTRPGMRIDLGGFAKGHAVDNAAAILRRRGVAPRHGERRRRQPRDRRPARPAMDDRRARSAPPGAGCRHVAARRRLDLDFGRLRALLRRRWHALSSSDRSRDRPIAARHTKRDSSCRRRLDQRSAFQDRVRTRRRTWIDSCRNTVGSRRGRR